MKVPPPLFDALSAAIGENDQSLTGDQRTEALRERFWSRRKLLELGGAYLQDKPEWWLAFDTVEDLAALLRAGAATPEMQTLLADFLLTHAVKFEAAGNFANTLRAGATTAEAQALLADYLLTHVVNKDEVAAFAALGVKKKTGAPRKDYERARTVATYELALENGQSARDAELEAFHELYPGPKNAYERLAARPIAQSQTGATNEAERRMHTGVRPLLRREGVLAPRPPGRKKSK